MSPKQALNLNLGTATQGELRKAESVLFKAKFRVMPSSPAQRELSKKYWEVRAALGWKPKDGENPFDWQGCIDKVSHQPGIYSPGGVCATAERRKMASQHGNPRFISSHQVPELLNLWHLSRTALSDKSSSRYDRLKWTAREFSKSHPEVSYGKVYKDLDDLTRQYNPANPDELESVFSPESTAGKLALAAAVPGGAVALTALELAEAVDRGLIDESAAVLMRPMEAVGSAVGSAVDLMDNPGSYKKAATDPSHPMNTQHYAYKAGFSDLTNAAARLGTTNLPPSAIQREDWKHAWGAYMRGWNEAKKRKYENPRRNPESDSSAMYESFHGTPSTKDLEILEEIHEHGHLAALGTLCELKVACLSGKNVEIQFDPDDNAGPFLAANEAGTQLYIVGGDQSVDISAMGMGGNKWQKEHMVLGVCYEVTYRTRKGFDSFQLTDYYHELGEETGVQPMLMYDTVNQKLSIAGGQYEIRPEGITN